MMVGDRGIRQVILTALAVVVLIVTPPTAALSIPLDSAVVYVHVLEVWSATQAGGDLVDVTLYLPQEGGHRLAYGPTDANGYVRMVGKVYPGDLVGVYLERGGVGGWFMERIPMRFCGFREIHQIKRFNLWVRVIHPSAMTVVRWCEIHDD